MLEPTDSEPVVNMGQLYIPSRARLHADLCIHLTIYFKRNAEMISKALDKLSSILRQDQQIGPLTILWDA